MRRTLSFLLALTISFAAFGQYNQSDQSIDWGDETRQFTNEAGNQQEILHFEGALVNDDQGNLPMVYKKIAIQNVGDVNVALSNTSFEPLINDQLVEDPQLIAEEVEIETSIGYERKQPFLIIQFIPLQRNVSGQIQKLTTYDLSIEIAPDGSRLSERRSSHSFSSNSVLSTGEWHRIGVAQSGVHRITRQFIEDNLGWDANNIDPRNISMFSTGGGMLPEPLDIPAPDDLEEIAIEVTGQGDGSFDNGDAILFYGEGPTKIRIDSSDPQNLKFSHQIHLYDTLTYYYITKDKGSGKRISTQSSEPSYDEAISGFSYYTFREKELDNLTESGRHFHGESFDAFNSSRSFDFTIPNIKTSQPLSIKVNLASRSVMGPSSFTLKANGQEIGSSHHTKVGINYYDTFARDRIISSTYQPISDNVKVALDYQPNGSDPESMGWLDYIGINARVQPQMHGNQMTFSDLETFGNNSITQFRLSAPSGIKIWDVSDYKNIQRQQANYSEGKYIFNVPTKDFHRFIAFNGNSFLTPSYHGTVANQNLHGNLGQPDMVIVTHASLKSQAERVANFHRNETDISVKVVEVQKVFNEFSGGNVDITAIRNMMKMLYERASNSSELPQYLLLFGDGSYDYKNIEVSADKNTNLVPTYQSYESLDRSRTFVSDDYFALLDDNEGHNIVQGTQLMDIAVGRIMADSEEEAKTIVDKIYHYHETKSYGSWRNSVTFIADDEDNNIHINDADKLAKALNDSYPVYNLDKIYLDAYEQISTPGGSRYPGVVDAINSRVFSGTLVMNYTGHGGEGGLAHERIVTHQTIRDWSNYDRLMLLVTATCSFSRYDNPNVETAGELSLTNDQGGAVSLISTVRLVYSGANYQLNKALNEELFEPLDGRMPTLGEVMMQTKNKISTNANNRKFALLGDPAMTLGYPDLSVHTTEVKGEPFSQNEDTISALEKVTIKGVVKNDNGSVATAFNGIVYPTIFDKAEEIQTLKNDPGSRFKTFEVQDNIIYKGKASVTNGAFEYTFVVPKDINYEYGSGKISYYANDGTIDAHGYDSLIVGGSADSFPKDNQGPNVKIYMNNEDFVFGGITDKNPVMLVKLSDENGINTAGNAIGHNITGILDGKDNNQLVLNEFYEAALDDYTKGEVRYPLSNLETGNHSVEVTAWDVYNNSGKGNTEFVVAESSELALDHVLNYPNPFTTSTEFWFEHNKPGQSLDIKVEIYTVSGRLVKTIQEQVVPEGYRVTGIEWNGLDDYGDEIGKGVYIYKVAVQAEDNTSAQKFEKLVILR